MHNHHHVLTLAAVALLAGPPLAAPDAEARTRNGSAQIQTQRGTATVNGAVSRTRGERTRAATVTGPNGRTSAVTDTRRRDREASAYSRDRTRTFDDGSTRAVTVDAQKTGEGAFSASRTVTGRGGETRTQTGDFTRTATDDGRTVSGRIETQNRGAVDYNREVAIDGNSRSVNAAATFEDGTSRTRAVTTVRDPVTGAVTNDASYVNRRGGETSVVSIRTPTDNGVVVARDATFADGSTRAVDRTRTNTGDGVATIERTVTGRNGETRSQSATVSVDRPIED
ncbi:MAG: hypothetical protein NW200_06955 [Hyphomonadaceae bacterium]|nr:hypothetical protein [Hyphomonadaceae bacterium]